MPKREKLQVWIHYHDFTHEIAQDEIPSTRLTISQMIEAAQALAKVHYPQAIWFEIKEGRKHEEFTTIVERTLCQ